MKKDRVVIGRRHFLTKSAYFFAGSLFGSNIFSKAFAYKKSSSPRIALIIDDIGFSRSRLDMFLDLEIPMTFAILPRLQRSTVSAEKIHLQGYEIILHQPMEPHDPNVDPGPGALYVGDKHQKILKIIEENISDFPYITGVNNHMGSKFTACSKEMNEVLAVIKQKGLFFIDSLTTNRSKAYQTAQKLHMPTAYRNIFLDNNPQEPVILSQLKRLKTHALRYGHAIGIGHPYPETVKAIRLFKESIAGSHISMVHVSDLIPA